MKIVTLLILVNLSFADAGYHEFEGVSESYNIRSLKVLAEFLPEEPIIIEVGAYQGRDTVKLAQKYPSAKIYAFEPLFTAFPQLLDAVRPYPNVSLFNLCVDQATGVRPFYICHGAHGESPIFEFHSSLLKPTAATAGNLLGPIEMVPCISLSDFCWMMQIDRIDMLWLSAEGNELQILQGAHETLDEVSLVYARSQLSLDRESITLFTDLKQFMEKNGFVLASHFHRGNFAGDALFVNKRKFN